MRELQANLDVREAARVLGVAVPTLRKWIRERRIGHVRAGRRILLMPSDVQRFMTAGHVEPDQEGRP